MKISSYKIFKTFFKIGTILLGGGYVILPLLQNELSKKHQWMNEDELCEYFALSQSLPGIIAVNMSVFTGYKLSRYKGAFVALLGVILPAFITILLFATLLQKIIHFDIIQGIFWGVEIGVIMLLYLAVKSMWNKSINDKFSIIIFFITFFLSACLKISPAIIILITVAGGIYLKRKFPTLTENSNEKRNCTR